MASGGEGGLVGFREKAHTSLDRYSTRVRSIASATEIRRLNNAVGIITMKETCDDRGNRKRLSLTSMCVFSSWCHRFSIFIFFFSFCFSFARDKFILIERWIFKWNIGGVSGLRLLRLFFGKLFNARIDFYIAYWNVKTRVELRQLRYWKKELMEIKRVS